MTSPGDSTRSLSASELAAFVTSASPGADQARAMEALRPTIERLAAEVARSLFGDIPQRLRDDAWGLLWEKLVAGTFDPGRGEFEGWCRTVLRSRASELIHPKKPDPVDLARSGAYLRAIPSEIEELPDRDRGDVAAEQAYRLNESLKEVRDRLDQAAGDWTARDVNFYPVFLLHLRQGLVNRLSRTWVAEPGDLPAGEMSSLAERCLPWHPLEALLTFRAGWPTLSAIWYELRPVADAPPYRLEGEAVCNALTRSRGGAVVTVDLWRKWTQRAREHARSLIDSNAWERLFVPWLPPPRRVGRPPESHP
jgi:hypothetical protein